MKYLALAISVVAFMFTVAIPANITLAAERTYYIAADEVVWDYAPSDMNLISNEPFTEHEWFWTKPGPHKIGKEYKKAIYREYTDNSFTELKPIAPEWEHLGTMGPVIRANVGDTITIVFRNNVPFAASVHPHGVFYDKDSEGAGYSDGTGDASAIDNGVPTGGTHTFTWPVPERAGPREGGRSTVLWMYHSHADEVADVNAGLFGPMIIGRNETNPDNGRPTDVDREFVVGFFTTIENSSHYIEDNINTYMSDPKGVKWARNVFGGKVLLTGEPDAAADGNIMENINGYIFGNQPMMTMREGERVRWYIMASSNFEVHAAHWHGNVMDVGDMNADVVVINTMEMVVGDMLPDNPGTWLMHCHVGGHMEGGMIGRYRVLPSDAAARDGALLALDDGEAAID